MNSVLQQQTCILLLLLTKYAFIQRFLVVDLLLSFITLGIFLPDRKRGTQFVFLRRFFNSAAFFIICWINQQQECRTESTLRLSIWLYRILSFDWQKPEIIAIITIQNEMKSNWIFIRVRFQSIIAFAIKNVCIWIVFICRCSFVDLLRFDLAANADRRWKLCMCIEYFSKCVLWMCTWNPRTIVKHRGQTSCYTHSRKM